VILAPSNPVSSIAPIMAVPGIRRLYAKAVPASRPSADCRRSGSLGTRGNSHAGARLSGSIKGVAEFYHDFLDLLVVDSKDSQRADELQKSGLRVHCTQTLMRTQEDRIALAKAVLSLALRPPATQAASEHP